MLSLMKQDKKLKLQIHSVLRAMKPVVECCIWFLLLSLESGCTEQEPNTAAQQEPTTRAQYAPTSRPVLPARQDVRVNDTLVLECRRPYTTLPQYKKPSLTMWSHMALRGRKGYYEVLSYPDTLSLYCLYQCQDEELVSAQGDILQFSALDGSRVPWEKVRSEQPLPDKAVYALDPWVWDVRYRQYAKYMTADLKVLDRRDEDCFTGGVLGDPEEEYRLLPHWISREQASLKRLHRLPPARRLLAYCNFSAEIATVEDLKYIRGYGPLLLNLLRVWRAYPMPVATARHLDRKIQELTTALHKARRTR